VSFWSWQVSPRRGLGLDAWCLPPIPVINEAAARFAESASNLGRQIAKVVGELMIFAATVDMLAISTLFLVFLHVLLV
jgi:hypothetical protein